jgi:hypothetical protein
MTTELIISILQWAVGVLLAATVYLIRWGIRIEANIIAHKEANKHSFQEHDLRLRAVEELTKYLVEAGKNLKDQQAAMNLTVNSIQIAIVEMNKNIEKIIVKLDKYDENITNFYKDFDLKHKQEHKA